MEPKGMVAGKLLSEAENHEWVKWSWPWRL